jgi:hypothetical protein
MMLNDVFNIHYINIYEIWKVIEIMTNIIT